MVVVVVEMMMMMWKTKEDDKDDKDNDDHLEERPDWGVEPGLGDGRSSSQRDLGLDHLVNQTPEC